MTANKIELDKNNEVEASKEIIAVTSIREQLLQERIERIKKKLQTFLLNVTFRRRV